MGAKKGPSGGRLKRCVSADSRENPVHTKRENLTSELPEDTRIPLSRGPQKTDVDGLALRTDL